MINFWQLLFILLLILPPLASAILLVTRKHRKVWLTLTWLIESLLLLLLLVFSPDNTVELPFTILTGHPMGLATSSTGIKFVVLLALSGLALTLFTDSSAAKPFLWRSILNLWLFLLAAIVLFSADFLTRLAALELSIIFVALYPLTDVETPMNRRWMHFLEVYIPLRIAGAFLLSVIFPLAIQNDNFQINGLLEMIADQGSISQLLMFFLLAAVAIKSTSPPFDRWLTHSSLASDPNWGFGSMVVTSSLAYYLVYRFLQILPNQTLVYLGIAFLLTLLANLKMRFSNQIVFDRRLFFTAQNFPTVLILLAAGEKSLLYTFLLVIIPLINLSLVLGNRWNFPGLQPLLKGIQLAVRIIFPLLTIPLQQFQPGSIFLFYAILSLQILLFAQTLRVLHPSVTNRETARMRTSNEYRERSTFRELTQSIVDLEFHLDHLTRYANQLFRNISKTINRVHNDSLDRYLYWTAFFILMLFIFIFIG